MNPVLRKLGFSPNDRVVVVHADDVGMCQATLPAIEELMEFGVVTSASAMVPCPAFPDVAAWQRRQPNVDVGVHLTLTSEWESCRWQALSNPSRDSGLIDEQGYLHRERQAVREHANPIAIRAEMERQVDKANQSGLVPTHIDNHMFAVMCDEFLEEYLQISFERGLPAFLPRVHGKSDNERSRFQKRAIEWESRGLPVFDCCRVVTKRSRNEDRVELVREVFDRLPAGLSCVLLHPAIDTPEIRHIASDWQSRVADFEAFRNPELREHIGNLGIQLISYQPLRDAMLQRLLRSS